MQLTGPRKKREIRGLNRIEELTLTVSFLSAMNFSEEKESGACSIEWYYVVQLACTNSFVFSAFVPFSGCGRTFYNYLA